MPKSRSPRLAASRLAGSWSSSHAKLQCRRIRRDRQAGPLLEPMDASVGRQRVGRGGRACVLPSDRPRNRASRPSIPQHDALAFVRYSDPRHVRRRGARRAERLMDALLGSLPDLVHVELDPPGLRVVHGLGALRRRDRLPFRRRACSACWWCRGRSLPRTWRPSLRRPSYRLGRCGSGRVAVPRRCRRRGCLRFQLHLHGLQVTECVVVEGRVLRVDVDQRVRNHCGGRDPRKPLAVRRDHVPRRPRRAGVTEHLRERLLVAIPVPALLHVVRGELPIVIRQIDAPKKAERAAPPSRGSGRV